MQCGISLDPRLSGLGGRVYTDELLKAVPRLQPCCRLEVKGYETGVLAR